MLHTYIGSSSNTGSSFFLNFDPAPTTSTGSDFSLFGAGISSNTSGNTGNMSMVNNDSNDAEYGVSKSLVWLAY